MMSLRSLGVIFLIAGAVLLLIGVDASHSAADRWTNFFTGHFTDDTARYITGGVGCAVVGGLMTMFGGGK
jgi:hypothetical protein